MYFFISPLLYICLLTDFSLQFILSIKNDNFKIDELKKVANNTQFKDQDTH